MASTSGQDGAAPRAVRAIGAAVLPKAELLAAGSLREVVYGELRTALRGTEPTPRYLQIATVFRTLVERGVLRAGEALPSERDLSTVTGLSRVTVRRAVETLLREGVLSRHHGSGTFVARRLEQPLSILAGFSEDMRNRGTRPGSIWISKTLSHPSPKEALALGVGPDEQVLRLLRVRTADDEALALETAVVSASILPSPDLVSASLYGALAEHGFRPAHGVQRLHAALAAAEEARLLMIPLGSAILRIERRAFLANGRPIEFTTSAYRGDRYDFVATLGSKGSEPEPGSAS
jgi:GntR family transcriptional regulator